MQLWRSLTFGVHVYVFNHVLVLFAKLLMVIAYISQIHVFSSVLNLHSGFQSIFFSCIFSSVLNLHSSFYSIFPVVFALYFMLFQFFVQRNSVFKRDKVVVYLFLTVLCYIYKNVDQGLPNFYISTTESSYNIYEL